MASALLKKLRRNLADLIDPESARQPASAHAKTRAVTEEMLYDRIRILAPAGRDPSAKTGQVNLISMRRIRERLGSGWPHHAVNADRIARNAIERYLIGGDIYARWKDEGYIVVFATLDNRHAQIKCKLIGDEIVQKLFGEDEHDLTEIHHVAVQADGAVTFSRAPHYEELIARIIPEAAAVAQAALPPIPGPPPSPIKPAPAAAPDAANPLAELSFRYRPSWDPGRGVIAAYLCLPMLPVAPGSDQRWRAALVLQHDAAALEKLDFVMLDHAIEVLEKLVRDKRRLLITVPVRFETLSALAHRRRYIEILHTRLSSEAASLLVIELVRVPVGVPEARLLEITAPLRAHARAVMARLRPETADFTQFANARVAAVGCDLGEQSGSEVALMQQMARFSKGASKAGIATYLRNAGSLSLAAAALGAGFSHIDGDAVAEIVDQPRGIVEFSLLDLYEPAVKG
ncbi:MAG TPA: hypothetical protein VG328_08425 [Stellaceae bacterium]|nr:hypothetical protein [Stellaceae bacterium]